MDHSLPAKHKTTSLLLFFSPRTLHQNAVRRRTFAQAKEEADSGLSGLMVPWVIAAIVIIAVLALTSASDTCRHIFNDSLSVQNILVICI